MSLPDTELRNRRSEHIDKLPVDGILRVINNEDALVAEKVGAEIPHIALAVNAAEAAIRRGGRVIYVGCGTSGRLGVLDASECPPTYGVEPGLFVGVIAGGSAALVVSVEGAEDDEGLAEQDMAAIAVCGRDFVVSLAASGRTPYALAAIRAAKAAGAATALVACTKGFDKPSFADILIAVDTGAEVVTGSTRMKAGTAQKMVLNMISTATMIRLGKVFGNLMVDMRPTNAKLTDRARRIITEVTGRDNDAARAALDEAGGNVKTAILTIKAGVNLEAAEAMLTRNGGRLADALAEAGA